MKIKILRCPSCGGVFRDTVISDSEIFKCDYCGNIINVEEFDSEEYKNINLLIDLAEVEISNSSYDKALQYIDKILEDYNDNKEALWLKFKVLMVKYTAELFYYSSNIEDDTLTALKEIAIEAFVKLFKISSEPERKVILAKLNREDFSGYINNITVLSQIDAVSNHTNAEILSLLLILSYDNYLELYKKNIPVSNRKKAILEETETNLKKIDEVKFTLLNDQFLSDKRNIDFELLSKKSLNENHKKSVKTSYSIAYLLFILIVLIIILLFFF